MKTILISFLLLSITFVSNAQNRVLWKFLANDSYIQGRPAIGADGTIYALGINGHLYALTPKGKLKWTYTVLQGSVQSVSVGNNGVIYFAGLNSIYAIKPNGTLKWQITNKQGGLFDAGPTVGPDGNIYAVADNQTDSGLGAISITPAGKIRWNKLGYIHANGTAGQTKEIIFSAGQLYFCLNRIDAISGLQALSMSNGERLWTKPGDRQPAISKGGRIYTISAFLTGSFAEISAYDVNGNLLKKYFGNGTKDITSPDIDSAGIFYVGKDYQLIVGENPNGTQKFSVKTKAYVQAPAVSPLNNLIVAGSSQSLAPGYVTGVSNTGILKWSVLLSLGGDNYATPISKPKFSNNGLVVYIGTALNYTTNACYLYAISTDSPKLTGKNSEPGFAESNFIKSNKPESGLSFYPNPAVDIIYVKANGKKTITITDNAARIFASKLIDGFGDINLSSVPQGIYFISDGSAVKGKPVIIKK